MSDELEKRVADLERRVTELESQPRETHFHYHQPIYQPYVPPVQPTTPLPWKYDRIYIGDPPYWPNTTGTVTWSGGDFTNQEIK